MIVDLRQVTDEPYEIFFDQTHDKLKSQLVDLIGENGFFNGRLTVLSDGPVYWVEGHIQTSYNLLCTRCAKDLEQEVNIPIKEILVVGKEDDEKNQQHKMNAKDDIFCSFLKDIKWDLGPFIREHIALFEPDQPTLTPDCWKKCTYYDEALKAGWAVLPTPVKPTKIEPETKHKPFEALDKLIN